MALALAAGLGCWSPILLLDGGNRDIAEGLLLLKGFFQGALHVVFHELVLGKGLLEPVDSPAD